MFKKILIANRGEIACRIIRTAHQYGIYCIAVYSTEDAHALHVKLADEAHCIGPAEAHLSYLNQARLIATAFSSGAEAIHPGYGFLSENADFAALCESNGLIFIGAPSQAIRLMGSKIAAKQLMVDAQVPLLPGYHGDDQSEERLAREAQRIGFPVLIKASAGGGGKGMRVVEDAAHFLEALAGCKREAQAAFDNDAVLLEKYLRQPRHIEIQIFADQHGNCVHLFERDCSVQRRHQKVIEEAPAPHLSEELRHQMGMAAIQAAKSVAYVGAGTIEFLFDQGKFYFMEMNTRLQVEHPVTEMISGQDLVAWQLKVAAGDTLPLNQTQLKPLGHAIEVRLYAEDPDQDFLPCTGTITQLVLPELSNQVRLDTGIQVLDHVGIYYDPMLAKLISFGQNRAIACQLLQQALHQTLIGGVKTNLAFLSRLISLDAYQRAVVHTDFIPKHHQALLPTTQILPPEVLLCLCAQELETLLGCDSRDPWSYLIAWRNGGEHWLEWHYEYQGQNFNVKASPVKDHWQIVIDQQAFYLKHWSIQAHRCQLSFSSIETNTTQRTACALMIKDRHEWQLIYQTQRYWVQQQPRFQPQATVAAQDHHLLAPMPGRILAQLCHVDQTVEQGQALLVMEAMKMEYTLRAPRNGNVLRYLCALGDVVSEGDLLVEFM